ncbi:MAG: DUF167 domain-containing protein [Planctomycetes bacterium]|nr:DUF167 domain-containing protein [Planctomycetota bacterium]
MPSLPDIEPWRDGSALPVKAHAGARRDAVTGVHDGRLKVEVTTAPEKGKANRAIARLLAKTLGLPAASVELLSGETGSRKRFGIGGLDPARLAERLNRVLATESDGAAPRR